MIAAGQSCPPPLITTLVFSRRHCFRPLQALHPSTPLLASVNLPGAILLNSGQAGWPMAHGLFLAPCHSASRRRPRPYLATIAHHRPSPTASGFARHGKWNLALSCSLTGPLVQEAAGAGAALSDLLRPAFSAEIRHTHTPSLRALGHARPFALLEEESAKGNPPHVKPRRHEYEMDAWRKRVGVAMPRPNSSGPAHP